MSIQILIILLNQYWEKTKDAHRNGGPADIQWSLALCDEFSLIMVSQGLSAKALETFHSMSLQS